MIFLFISLLLFTSLSSEISNNDDIGYIWHIADLHVDLNYTYRSNPYCAPSDIVCCRKFTKVQSYYAGKYGTPYANCDIPLLTYREILEFIRDYDLSKEPDMVIFGGDSHSHDDIDQTIENTLMDFDATYETLVDVFKECDTKVFGTIGNHDGFPVDQLAKPPFGAWLIDPYSQWLSNWFNKEITEFVKKFGYFSFDFGMFHVINLNGQWTSKMNLFVWGYPLEKTHKMRDYLESELEYARSNNMKVILVDHIPADEKSYNFKKWNAEFLELVVQYSDTIVLQLYGHDHNDRFFLQRDDQGNPVGVSLLVGSLTTWTKLNPEARLIKYSRKTGDIIDIITYVNDIEKSNDEGTMKNSWFSYSYKEDYKMTDLSPKSFDDLFVRIKNDDELYDKYMYWFNNGYQKNNTCWDQCRINMLCDIKYTNFEKLDDCKKNQDP